MSHARRLLQGTLTKLLPCPLVAIPSSLLCCFSLHACNYVHNPFFLCFVYVLLSPAVPARCAHAGPPRWPTPPCHTCKKAPKKWVWHREGGTWAAECLAPASTAALLLHAGSSGPAAAHMNCHWKVFGVPGQGSAPKFGERAVNMHTSRPSQRCFTKLQVRADTALRVEAGRGIPHDVAALRKRCPPCAHSNADGE